MRVISADALVMKQVSDGVYIVDAEAIRNAPTFDAAPVVHGEWIYYNNNGWRVCSHCKDRRRTFTLDNYCPNCGAKMDGGKE